MDVAIHIVRNIVIEDVSNAFHVNPARRYVRRDEEFQLRVTERAHHLLALRLRQVAVQLVRLEARGLQRLVQRARPALRAAEDHR
ncbi:hypothetical protein D3C81_1384650 [compost metagenome]